MWIPLRSILPALNQVFQLMLLVAFRTSAPKSPDWKLTAKVMTEMSSKGRRRQNRICRMSRRHLSYQHKQSGSQKQDRRHNLCQCQKAVQFLLKRD